jgi:pimeloyl-ACP methyl ester carboxylesterase
VELRAEGPGSDLAGTLTLPDSRAAPVLVYVHGATEGTRDALLARHLGSLLPQHGIGLVVFDRRGEGESRGDPNVSIQTLAADVEAWLVRLRECERVDPRRLGLFAHSQGGWIAPLVARQARCLVAVSPSGVSPDEQMRFAVENLLRQNGYGDEEVERALRFRATIEAALQGRVSTEEAREAFAAIESEPWRELAFLGDPEDPETKGWRDWIGFDVTPALRAFGGPALLFVGARDRWIPVDRTVEIWRDALGERLTVVSLEQAGHFPTQADDPSDWTERGPILDEYEATLVEWLVAELRP